MSTTLDALEARVAALEAAAEVDANSLTAKTTPASTDDLLLFGNTDNAGSKITFPNFAKSVNESYGNAYMYRNMTRSTNLTSAWYNGTLKSEVAAGNFANVRPGDYIIGSSSGKKYWVADLDTYYNVGTSVDGTSHVANYHHLVMLPAANLTTAKMNESNDTTGGYLNSAMKQTTLPSMITTYLSPDFGENLKTYSLPLSSGKSTAQRDSGLSGGSNIWTWAASQCDLLNETNIYGAEVWGSAYDVGIQKEQLALFRMWGCQKVFGRADIWLKDVASSAYFAAFNASGAASCNPASNSLGVRPWFLIG